tara:strand:+ start:30 stop:539 length:510 start_codon:yes stop_codon:yes gene_type:complete
MHNLHYLVTRAETPQEACSQVESEISEWGTDNNWRTICGCISEDNVIHSTGEGRWKPTETDTLEKINLQVSDWLYPPDYYEKQFNKCVDGKEESAFDWYGAKKHCKHMYQMGRTLNSIKHDKRETFDVLKDEFYSWSLNECGVTSLDNSGLDTEAGGSKLYVVYLDMHD